MTNIRRKAAFSLGKVPTFDPCKDCVVGMVCDKDTGICVDKVKYNNANIRKEVVTKIKAKKVKKQNIRRNINGIRR